MSNTEEKPLSKVLLWGDSETTGFGLDRKDWLLELALVVTDNDLNELGSFSSVISPATGRKLDKDWVWEKHFETGLVDEINAVRGGDLEKSYWVENVEKEAIDFLAEYCVDPNEVKPPLCGSTIGFDIRFLQQEMPNLLSHVHYRSIDVSSIRELQRRWCPDLEAPPKAEAHRALADVYESIGFLKHFWNTGFIGTGRLVDVEKENAILIKENSSLSTRVDALRLRLDTLSEEDNR